MSAIKIGLAGNPNCGKTTLFNALTGAKQKVGNWPGVTVERKTGVYTHKDKELEVVDLPGIYSLSATSLDEMISRDFVISGEPDLILNIVDASNLERNLYLKIGRASCRERV
jgi:ferrous iron transport protein B